MKSFTAHATLFAIVSAVGLDAPKDDKGARFAQWAAKHNKNYKNKADNDAHFAAWSKKDADINNINSNPKNTFTVGHNKFSDKTQDEITQMFLPHNKLLPKLA